MLQPKALYMLLNPVVSRVLLLKGKQFSHKTQSSLAMLLLYLNLSYNLICWFVNGIVHVLRY